MERIMNYQAPCEHTKNFNRIFALLIFLLSELATIIAIFAVSLFAEGISSYNPNNIEIELEPIDPIQIFSLISSYIPDTPTLTFCTVFSIIILAPINIISIIFFIMSMIKGKNLVIPSIILPLICKILTYSTYGTNSNFNTIGFWEINIDLVLLGVVLILHVVLEYIYFNKDKGVLLTVLQCIKIALTITLIIFISQPLFFCGNKDIFAKIIVVFFIRTYFILIEGIYLTSIYRKIPKSGIISASLVFVIGITISIFSIYIVEQYATTNNEPRFLEEQPTYYIYIVLFVIYLIFSIVLCIFTQIRINKIKENEKNKVTEENEVKEDIVEESNETTNNKEPENNTDTIVEEDKKDE